MNIHEFGKILFPESAVDFLYDLRISAEGYPAHCGVKPGLFTDDIDGHIALPGL